MTLPFLGEFCALGAALSWALALVWFKISGESIRPLSLSLFKNVIGIVLLVATLPFFLGGQFGIGDLAPEDIYILILSGVVGIAIADTLLFYSLNIIGVGLLTIMECTYTPAVFLFAVLFHSQQLAVYHYVGGALVLSGVFLSSTHKPPARRTRAQLLVGMLLGVSAMGLMALGIVVAQPIIEEAPLVPVVLIRVLGGTAVLAAFIAARPDRGSLLRVFKPCAAWKTSVPASVCGMYVAMLLWVAGFKYADAAVAATLNQTSTIMALVFAWLILKESFTRRKLAAAGLALSGVLVVTVCSYGR